MLRLIFLLMVLIPFLVFGAVNDLTVYDLDEDGLTEANLDPCQGTGTAPDGDRFVNNGSTIVWVHVSGHDTTLTVTVEPEGDPTVTIPGFGEITVPDLTYTLTTSDVVPQDVFFVVPASYRNSSNKNIVKITSANTFVAGEVKIAVFNPIRRK